jgi:hypothetical protein
VSGALLVSGAAAFAGNLALLFRGHRRETSPFFAFSCIHYWTSVFLNARVRAMPNHVRTFVRGLWGRILDARGTRLVGRCLRSVVGVAVALVPIRIACRRRLE